jgi:hypothetical protein
MAAPVKVVASSDLKPGSRLRLAAPFLFRLPITEPYGTWKRLISTMSVPLRDTKMSGSAVGIKQAGVPAGGKIVLPMDIRAGWDPETPLSCMIVDWGDHM